LIVVGIVAALAAEARILGSTTRRGGRLSSLADGSLLCVSGIGDAAARAAASTLIAGGARGLISWGVAGGLDPALAPGTLLLPTAVTVAGGGTVATSAAWRAQVAAAARGAHLPVSEGMLLSSRAALGSAEAKAAAFAATGAVAVDMESLAIGQVARSHGLPFIIVRAVVDAATDTLPPLLMEALSAGAPLSLARLVAGVARSPRELGDLMRLARRFRAARRTLRSTAPGVLAAAPAP